MAALLAIFFTVLAVFTTVLFSARIWWLPELVSAHGAAIDRQFAWTLGIAGVVFLLAQILLAVAIFKFRGAKRERAESWHERPALEIGWTVATAAIFIALGLQGNFIWARYIEPSPADAVVVEVTGQQFAWNVRYPGKDGQFGKTNAKLADDAMGDFWGLEPNDKAGQDDVTAQNIVAVPVNRPVRVILKARDVTHSFFVPQLRVKQDAVPGMAISVGFTATKTGEYEIACAELCGLQHYKMKGRLQVMTDADFKQWLASRAPA